MVSSVETATTFEMLCQRTVCQQVLRCEEENTRFCSMLIYSATVTKVG